MSKSRGIVLLPDSCVLASSGENGGWVTFYPPKGMIPRESHGSLDEEIASLVEVYADYRAADDLTADGLGRAADRCLKRRAVSSVIAYYHDRAAP